MVDDAGAIEAALAARLVGVPALRASTGYAGEVSVHFGREVSYRNRLLEKRTRGSHVLRAYCSAVAGAEGLEGAARVEQLLVEWTGVAYGIAVQLSSGHVVTVVPADDDGESRLPDFQLLTPAGVLTVGPGRSWSVEVP